MFLIRKQTMASKTLVAKKIQIMMQTIIKCVDNLFSLEV